MTDPVISTRVILDDEFSALSIHVYAWKPGADRTVRLYTGDDSGTLVPDLTVSAIELVEVLAGGSVDRILPRADAEVVRNTGGEASFFIRIPEPGLTEISAVYKVIHDDGTRSLVAVDSSALVEVDYRTTVPPRPPVELQGLGGPNARGEMWRSQSPCIYYSSGASILSWRPPETNGCGGGVNSLGYGYGDIYCSYGTKRYFGDRVEHGCGKVYHDTGEKFVTLSAGTNGWTEITTDCITPPNEGATTYITDLTFTELIRSAGGINFAQWGIYGTQWYFDSACAIGDYRRATYMETEMWFCDGGGSSCSQFSDRLVTKTMRSALSTRGYSLSITVWGAAPGSGFQFCSSSDCGQIPSGGPGVSWNTQTRNLQTWTYGGVLPSVEEV